MRQSCLVQLLLMVVCLTLLLIGLAGIVVPVLPGLWLCLGAVALWAFFSDAGWGRWLVLGLSAVVVALGLVAKYAWPGRRMKSAGVPNSTMLTGIVFAIMGMFVIPLVGLPVGFVLGIWLAEARRLRGFGAAWPSTAAALKATGLAVMVELSAGFLVTGIWVGGLIFA
jgi:uncharacterized protein YqgC (DUF456 family)